jgi:AhpD family alkylhydroperoxidase
MIRQEPSMVTEARAFDRHRPLLFSIAYRMLGSVMDAEDVVQEAYLHWRGAKGEIRSPEAYLSTVVSRLSIDRLRSAKARRERYVGPWLPEPLVTGEDADVAEAPVVGETLSMAFLVLLESLNPVESQQERMTRLFVEACAGGDIQGLLSLLSEDVVLYSDGGGTAVTARNPVYRSDRVARLLLGLARKRPAWFTDIRLVRINGRLGVVGYWGDLHQRYYPRGLRRADTGRPQRAKLRQAARRAYPERDQDEGGKVKTRMLMATIVPDGYQAIVGLERWMASTGLDKRLHDLIKIRASQINGCVFCIDLHTRDARKHGEQEARIYALDAWREYPFFSREERAALALTEAVTLLSETRVPDDVWEEAQDVFGDEYLAKVLMAIVTINAWNRIAVSTRMAPAAPQP